MRALWRTRAVAAPGRVSAELIALVKRVLLPLVRLCHRPTLEGTENLPEGPFLLVANHSGGLGLAELLCFLARYVERYENTRPLAAFAHPLSFAIYPASLVMRHVGAVPSTYEAADAALAAGVPLLVFPGGDYETTRPLWHARRVDFGGRRGFLRLAKKHGIPIVPMGIAGSHITAPILFQSTWLLPRLLVLPHLIGLKRWCVTLLGVVVTVLLALGSLAL